MEGTRDEVKGFYSIPLSRQGFLRGAAVLCVVDIVQHAEDVVLGGANLGFYGLEHCLGSGFVVSVVAAFPRARSWQRHRRHPHERRSMVRRPAAHICYLRFRPAQGPLGLEGRLELKLWIPPRLLGGRRLHQGDWLVDGFDIFDEPGSCQRGGGGAARAGRGGRRSGSAVQAELLHNIFGGCAEIQKSLEVYLPSFGIGYRLAILGR